MRAYLARVPVAGTRRSSDLRFKRRGEGPQACSTARLGKPAGLRIEPPGALHYSRGAVKGSHLKTGAIDSNELPVACALLDAGGYVLESNALFSALLGLEPELDF